MDSRCTQVYDDGCGYIRRFSYRLGEVFSTFLFDRGAQTALLPNRVLNYNPYTEKQQKRLARYFSWIWRVQAKKGDYLKAFRVKTLIDVMGVGLIPKRALRILDRLEEVLDSLRKDGIIADWQYKKWDKSIIGTCGWGQRSLNWTVVIKPPEAITRLRPPKQAAWSRATKDLLPNAELGVRLHDQRTERGLCLREAADQIGVPPDTLCPIERGAVKPSRGEERRILKWLAGVS